MAAARHCSLLALLTALSPPSVGATVTVHLVPHTHDDVGWLKTVDQYYTGQNNSIAHAYVKMILDTLVDSLLANENRTFTYVEMAFFERWWRQQSPKMRDVTRALVAQGQLSFTNGGWCMHDEAAPFYLDMIDQTTLGHRFLMEEFGVAPKTGWQLDPFGHSSTQAALLSAEVGMVGLFFGRIDYQDLDHRIANSSAEFIWRASPSLGPDAQVFAGLTGEYHGNYGPPPGFNWDVHTDDEPVQDDPALGGYNVPSRVADFVEAALWQANHTRGSNVMFTMGSDFQYENAREWYDNLDRIIKYVNEDGRVQALYSTPEKYLAAKAAEKDSVEWPLKTDDFFPYADGPHMFWTGYFTSRPALKRYIRESSAFLQVLRHLVVLGGSSTESNRGVQKLEEAMGVAQHHDAVSGTAKQHVTFDYAARLAAGRLAALGSTASTLANLTGMQPNATFAVCDLRNVSVCLPTSQVSDKQMPELDVIFWNGLAQQRTEVVELPAGDGDFCVFRLDGGEAVPSQLVPSLPSVTNYGGDAGGSNQTLIFKVMVPPFGFQGYKLARCQRPTPTTSAPSSNEVVTLQNDNLVLRFQNGLLFEMSNKVDNITVQVEQSWFMYNGSKGDNTSDQASGAYIFRPSPTGGPSPAFGGEPSLRVTRGPIADEVYQTFNSWISQRIRLSKGPASYAEITHTVGPVPVGDGVGREVVSRFTTSIKNAGVTFTDSNGREMLERRRDYRATWKLNQTEPVAGNYFPVTTALFIRDEAAQVTVLTDASQAGTGSVVDGEVELMVHRRLLVDDSRGVGEPLNETRDVTSYAEGGSSGGVHEGPGLVVRGQHWLTLGVPSSAAAVWRPLVDRMYMPVFPFFKTDPAAVAKGSYSALASALPPNVQVVSLSQWDVKRVLLRLAHQFGVGEDAELSKPATVDLADLFADYSVLSIDERGLAATIPRQEVVERRVQWKVDGEQGKEAPTLSRLRFLRPEATTVELGPLQIRTFLLELAPKHGSRAAVLFP